MARLTKKQKEAQAKIDPSKVYSLNEASALVKEVTNVNFDASVDLAIRLGPRHPLRNRQGNVVSAIKEHITYRAYYIYIRFL